MKVEFKNTTNKLFKELEGIKGTLVFGLQFRFDFTPNENTSFELRKGIMSSSTIKEYKTNEISMGCYEISIKTHNSEYEFIYGTYNKETPTLTQEEKDNIILNSMLF